MGQGSDWRGGKLRSLVPDQTERWGGCLWESCSFPVIWLSKHLHFKKACFGGLGSLGGHLLQVQIDVHLNLPALSIKLASLTVFLTCHRLSFRGSLCSPQ